MSIKPWLSIPMTDAKIAIDYDFGELRIMFKDAATVETAIKELEELKILLKEKEDHEH